MPHVKIAVETAEGHCEMEAAAGGIELQQKLNGADELKRCVEHRTPCRITVLAQHTSHAVAVEPAAFGAPRAVKTGVVNHEFGAVIESAVMLQ